MDDKLVNVKTVKDTGLCMGCGTYSSICPTKAMLDGAFELDKAYIPTRYPDAYPTGSPSGRYIQGEARRLIQHAENIIRLCEGLLSKTDQS